MLYDAGLDIMEVRNKDNDNRKRYLVYVTVPSSSRKPCFDLIIVRNTSRFARNINATQILEQLKQLKVYVYFCDIDKTTERDTDMEDIQAHILAAERESRIKSRLVIFGTNEGAKEGVIRASRRLYGYKFIKAEYPIDDRLEIIEDEAKVIQQIYQWYLEGLGTRRIVQLLTENNIFTRKGKEFGKNTVRGILTNEKYKGWNVRNKYNTGVVFHKYTNAKVRDKSEWIIHNDEKTKEKIPPIVSEEVFDKVQELLEGKREHQFNVGKYCGISEFASRIKCGKCGAVYYANSRKGKRYYNCSIKKKYSIERCNNKDVTLEQINERISPENYRKDIYEANIYFGQILRILVYKLMKCIDEKASEKVIILQQELKKEEEKKKRIVDIYTRGDIEDDDYTERIKPVNEKIEQLNLEIGQLSKNNNDIMQDIKEVKETASKFKEDFKVLINQSDKEFKKIHTREEIVKDIIQITVQPDGTMDIDYKSFEKYYKLVEKHRRLLDIFLPEKDYDKAKQVINDRVKLVKEDILAKIKESNRVENI